MNLARARKLAIILTTLALAGSAALAGVILIDRNEAAAAPALAPDDVNLDALRQVPPERWAALREKRILFAHQSVGADVVAGLQAILARVPEIGLRVESGHTGVMEGPGFFHIRVGKNGDAKSKTEAFARAIADASGGSADIAMLKFCYAELRDGDDPQALFDLYRTTVSDLREHHPDVRVVHVTIPLTTIETGPKSRAKRLLGRPLRGYADNIPRNRYNELLRTTFSGDAIFDLARAESQLPDGRPSRYTSDGETWDCLSTGFARDRGHPNEAGGIAAARDLLLVLADQCK